MPLSAAVLDRARAEGLALGREAVRDLFEPAAKMCALTGSSEAAHLAASDWRLKLDLTVNTRLSELEHVLGQDDAKLYLAEVVEAASAEVGRFTAELQLAWGNRAERRRARSRRR